MNNNANIETPAELSHFGKYLLKDFGLFFLQKMLG